jgi:hypothetical protein
VNHQFPAPVRSPRRHARLPGPIDVGHCKARRAGRPSRLTRSAGHACHPPSSAPSIEGRHDAGGGRRCVAQLPRLSRAVTNGLTAPRAVGVGPGGEPSALHVRNGAPAASHSQNPVTVLHTDPTQLEQLSEHGHPLGIVTGPLQPGGMTGQVLMVVELVDVVVVEVVVVDVVVLEVVVVVVEVVVVEVVDVVVLEVVDVVVEVEVVDEVVDVVVLVVVVGRGFLREGTQNSWRWINRRPLRAPNWSLSQTRSVLNGAGAFTL